MTQIDLLPADAAAPAPAVRIHDRGDGVVALRIGAADSANVLTRGLAAALVDALGQIERAGTAKVLVLEGGAQTFLEGGRAHFNDALAEGLFAAIVAFPVPLIAAMAGAAGGPGFLAGALCDFMVCSRDAAYRYTRPDAGLYPGRAEDSLFSERFGRACATDFLYCQTGATGTQLHGEGWTCAFLPQDEVESHAHALARRLAERSRDSLALLKQHLARPLHMLVDALQAVLVPDEGPGRACAALVFAARHLRLDMPAADVLHVRIDRGADGAAVLGELGALFGELGDGAAHGRPAARAVVLESDCDDFLPAPATGLAIEDALRFQDMLRESALPVVAVPRSCAGGKAWLVGQFCDLAVCARDGSHEVGGLARDADWAALAARVFSARYGAQAGRDIAMAGGRFSGDELTRHFGPMPVAAADQALAQALALAGRWAAWPPKTVLLRRAIPAPDGREPAARAPGVPRPGPLPAGSEVIHATVDADGIVVVRMEDRATKNLFSAAFVRGMDEVFRHVGDSPDCKAVVLVGFDQYFACGGTREALQAIQQGSAKFTDQQTYLLALACEIPVIAALQGHGIGGGLSLGLFADFVLLSEESKYINPYMGYGFTPGAGATLIVPDRLGRDIGLESLFTAQESSGSELKARGLRLPVHPRADLFDAAMALARRVAGHPRVSLVTLKRSLNRAILERMAGNTEQEIAMHERTFVGHAGTLQQIQANFNPMDTSTRTQVSDAQAAPSPGDIGATIKQLLAQELHMQARDIDPDTAFVDLGLDSITGVTWMRRINETYKTSIQATKVYGHPTLNQLAAYIGDEIARTGAPAAAAPEAPGPVPQPIVVPVPAPLPVPAATAAAEPRVPAPPRGTRPKLVSWRDQQPARPGSGRHTEREPVAVIGMAGMFPQANNLEQYWDNIAHGRNCIGEIPKHRWDIDAYYQAGDPASGKTNSRWMGHLEEYDLFDPLFFDISPREAMSMDPQQRVYLQTAWHAIEHAGYDPRSLSGSRCGVFVGCGPGDYHLLSRELQTSALGFTGGDTAILAARVSYFLDLQGPCLSIETACSSSLVAIATACDSLVSGASDLALAGGVGVMSGPELHVKMAQTGMLSRDGRCFTFDQRANGFAPAEGVGAVLLKRLSDAERDGDNILAVIHGWGVNQDGKTNGITAPNPEAQTRLQQEVYDKFGIDPAAIQMVEAHGTGTKLGDPIEVDALKASFGKYTNKTGYCALGSVKSNIGHCFTAAGVAGVIKVVLALRHRQLPPTINYDRLNEHIDLAGSPFYVNDRLRDWEPGGSARRLAAVSGFGFGGTNAHLVVGEYTAAGAGRAPACVTENGRIVFPLSARTAEQLKQQAGNLLDFITRHGRALDPFDVAYTLQAGRDAMDERLGILAASLDELAAGLRTWLAGGEGDGILHGRASEGREATSLLRRDADMRETIVDRLVGRRQLAKLLDLWIKGLEFGWQRLYGGARPRRIPLPGYPFAKVRYWIDGAGHGPQTKPAAAAAAAIHPLLHRNTSNLRQVGFSSVLRGDEAGIERLPDGSNVICGSAYLEMIRAAVVQAAGAEPAAALAVHDLAWGRPFVAGGGRELTVALYPDASGAVDVEIYSQDGSAETVHCRGRVTVGAGAASTAVQGGSRIELPTLESDGHALHPLLLDTVLKAWMKTQDSVTASRAWRFASAQRVRIVGPCLGAVTARIRPHAGQDALFDIEVGDEHGKLCVDVAGLALRVLDATDTPPAAQAPRPAITEARLLQETRQSLAAALFMDVASIHVDKPFIELGLDSIVGVEWVNALNKAYGIKLPAARLYDYPNLAELATYLHGEIERAAPAVPAAAPAPAGADKPRQSTLQQALKASLAGALYLPASEIQVDKPFIELGLDSIVGVEWINDINKQYGIKLAATRLYDYPTIAALAAFLSQQVAVPPEPVVAPGAPAQLAADARDAFPALARTARPAQAAPRAGAGSGGRIAVVGMSGRYPQARDLDQFWQNLVQGKNSVTEIPPSRWDVNQYYDPDPKKENKIYCKWMGVLDDIDCFDPLFFRVSPAEAENMDPQHRLFLEEGYRAFEHAGYSGKALSNKKCGVYVGIIGTEYADLVSTSVDITGNNPAIGAARIAYFLNLKGPAISIDTACSASLVAIHLACQGLLNHETDMALAGGVSVWLRPETYMGMCKAGMLSPQGLCKTFDNSADGFVPGEGVGAVVLKRLEDAERDNDVIYGVIAGSAINQDGKTNGITAPSVNSQIELERDLYERCGIDPATIDCVEAHGTGTRLGDPIELEALATVFKEKTAKKRFCALGSVKSNIGHTSGAAGVASLQKVLLCMKHRTLVPTLHVTRENALFDFDDSPFYVSKQARAWEAAGAAPRRATVSSFGFSGTNAHLVVEEYVPRRRAPAAGSAAGHLVPLSARTGEQLRQRALDLLAFIRAGGAQAIDFAALAATLLMGRDAMDERLCLVAGSVDQLAAVLDAWLAGGADVAHAWRGKVERSVDGVLRLAQQDGMDERVRDCVARADLAQLAQLWVRGLDLEWRQLYGAAQPVRMALPTYPFAKKRCWAAPGAAAARPAAIPAGYPPLQRNTTAPGQPGYSCTIAPHAGYLVEQGGRHVLPAAACLEMIRFAMMDSTPAAGHGAPLRLVNLAWGRPMVAGDRQLSIALLRQSDGRVDFEIYSLGAQADDEIVHCQGQARFAPGAAGRIAIDDLRRRMAREAGAGGRYRADGELLAPVDPLAGAAAPVDALFRAAERFTAGTARRPVHPALPFALDMLCIGPDAGRAALAWVRLADDAPAPHNVIRLDVDLCDEQGEVIALAHGLAFDAVRMAADAPLAPVRPAIVLDDPAAASTAAPAARAPVQITLD
jgi:acyl transferase domain-containing protein/enoyl-CoA hydratase/carnithine racemase/acyl carrier protein